MSKNTQEQNKITFKELLTNIIWSLKILYSLSKGDLIGLIAAGTLEELSPTINAFTGGLFLDELIKTLSYGGELSIFNLKTPLYLYLFLSACSYSFSALSRNSSKYFSRRYRNYHFRFLEFDIEKRISNLDIQQLENPEIFDMVKKSRDNMWNIHSFADLSTHFVAIIISLIISIIIAVQIDPLLCLIVMLLTIPYGFLWGRHIKYSWRVYNETTGEMRRTYRLMKALSEEKMIPEHKILKSNSFLYKLGLKIGIPPWKSQDKVAKDWLKTSMIVLALRIITYVLIPFSLLKKLFKGVITIGKYTFHQTNMAQVTWKTSMFITGIFDLFDRGFYVSQVRKLFEVKPALLDGTTKIDPTLPPKIEIKNVWFKYPNSKEYVLKNINMTINAKEEIAIVGENGAGKTTLIKLILRFYDPDKGEILINGIPIKELSLDTYYKAISTLFQDYNKYHMLTVEDNIRIGNSHKSGKSEEIKAAAQKADAEKFINSLDNKYKQILSKAFDDGTELSTGQWQKLALARMFYRDTPVLILDEPTASIDAMAEYKIFKRIYKFLKDKTVIIISHRFSTVRNAKKIYVLDKGKIIESGTHKELMKNNGTYTKAFELQAEGYT